MENLITFYVILIENTYVVFFMVGVLIAKTHEHIISHGYFTEIDVAVLVFIGQAACLA